MMWNYLTAEIVTSQSPSGKSFNIRNARGDKSNLAA